MPSARGTLNMGSHTMPSGHSALTQCHSDRCCATVCVLLQVLNVFKCGHLSQAAARAVADNCPRLKHLDVTDVHNFDLTPISEKCFELEVLEATSAAPQTVSSRGSHNAHRPLCTQHSNATDCCALCVCCR